jgi:CPA2 family monovalent cation:H+ antiporter-2
LGAFVFGAIIGSTRYRRDLERTFSGLQQMFGAVFFVAIGMLADFRFLLEAWPLVLGVTGLALVLRPLACSFGLMAVGNKPGDAVQAGLALVPLGEFSFVIAQLGVESGRLPPSFYAVAVGASLLTALAAPAFTRRGEVLGQWVGRAKLGRVGQWVLFYHEWLERLRTRQPSSLLWRLARPRLLQTVVLMVFVSALVLFANPLYQKVRPVLVPAWLDPDAMLFVFWTAFGILLLAPLIAVWRNVTALAMMVAESATSGLSRKASLRPLLEGVLRGVASLVIVVWLLTLLPSGWSLVGVAGGVLLVLVVVATVFWPRLVRFQTRLEVELRVQLRQASKGAANSSWAGVVLRQPADWRLDIDEVTLPSDSAHAGRTLAQLGVRQRFGCSVVGIDRQGFGMANPGATTVLYPLDRLLLLGSAPDLARAAANLGATRPDAGRSSDFDELTMEAVVVPEGCPLAGQPLAGLDLIRRASVQIGGIRRGQHRILNPGGQDSFRPGDELLVLGTHLQIKEFLALLSPPAAVGEPVG